MRQSGSGHETALFNECCQYLGELLHVQVYKTISGINNGKISELTSRQQHERHEATYQDSSTNTERCESVTSPGAETWHIV